MNNRTRIYGIDFSGARDAGTKIWIASGAIERERLRIDGCCRACDLPGAASDLEQTLHALRLLIAGEKTGVFGLDFPFGLPQALVAGKVSWEHFVLSFADDYATCQAFRQSCRQAAGGREFKRQTDALTRTPFSPYNLRLYRQTYYGIRDLLYPLVRERAASVLPMQAASPDRPWLIEICPTSTLKAEGVDHQLYKSRSAPAYDRRNEILERMEAGGRLTIAQPETRARILENPGGDALDSVIAALATYRAMCGPVSPPAADHAAYALEGYVYV